MEKEERRLVSREKEVLFEFFRVNGDSFKKLAEDASARAARFKAEDKEEIMSSTSGRFSLGDERHKIENMQGSTPSDREGVLVLRYDTSSEWVPLLKSRVRDLFQGFLRREPEDPRKRYRKPTLPDRVWRAVLRENVSRIHLYEAQERYVFLQRLLDYHEKTQSNSADKTDEKSATISICREALDSASVLLTRRQSDLNFLWREMTVVHIMLLDKVLPDEVLPAHLDFCNEEARRLGVTEDPEIKAMINGVAEAMDESPKRRHNKVRLLRGLIERFNTIRTGRIHDQLVNIRCYQKALLMLAPIAFLLIVMKDVILTGTLPKFDFSGFTSQVSWGFLGLGLLWNLLKDTVGYVYGNVVAFVFFAGLVGGFFSVTIRLRSRELEPGADAYFTWYVLTKPWIGALGAVILYILLQSGIVASDYGGSLLEAIKSQKPGAQLFAFAFLAGFSERIVFPNLQRSTPAPKS